MASVIITISIALTILFTFIYYFKRNKYNLPPGPKSLPVLGYLPFLGDNPTLTFKELSNKYGNIFSLRLGALQVIVLNDYKSAKEAFNNPFILRRPPGVFDFHPGNTGFAAYNDTEWIEQRRFCMRFLKDYGLKNVKWTEDVTVELEEFIAFLAEQDGKPVDIGHDLSFSVSNNMLSLVLGRRLPTGDPHKYIVSEAVDAMSSVFSQASLTSFYPKLTKFLAKYGIISLGNNLKKLNTLNKFLRQEVEIRKKFSDNQEEIFIDRYQQEIKKLKENNLKTTFTEYSLVGNMQNMIHGGSETTRTSIQWLFLAMASYPEIQKKVQNEIDQVLGSDGTCDFSERNKLPYTFATILECQRWRSVVPLGVLRSVSQDTTIGEFTVPKDACVIVNIWALHNDTNYWKDPEVFDPKRFLLENGTLNNIEPASYIPFSLGRRNCPGKLFALVEVFKYFLRVLQKFDIQPLEDSPPNLSGSTGISFFPHPQKLCFKLRK